MRKSKFNESQIVGILKEAESGVPVADGRDRSSRVGTVRPVPVEALRLLSPHRLEIGR